MSEIVFVKYCPDCQAENPRLQPLCTQCGTDLTMVRATPRQEAAPLPEPATPAVERTMRIAPETGPCCTLELVADPAVKIVVRAGQVVGRTNAADIALEHQVPDWQYISSRHAEFFRRGDQWFVKHVGHTNYNIVDGTEFSCDDEAALHDDSLLVLAKTAFRVRVGE